MKDVFLKWLIDKKIHHLYMDHFTNWHRDATINGFLERETPYAYVSGAFGWPNDIDWGAMHWAWCDYLDKLKKMRINANTVTL